MKSRRLIQILSVALLVIMVLGTALQPASAATPTGPRLRAIKNVVGNDVMRYSMSGQQIRQGEVCAGRR